MLGPDPVGDVDEELEFHIEMRIRELIARGETPERARELAMRRFGDYESSRTECVEIDERRTRQMARSEYFAELRQDLAYALRTLRRTPGFTIVAVASLALGIGATSAIFSVVHGVILQSLPYPAAERLYEVRTVYPDGTEYPLSAPDFMSIREGNKVFDKVEAYTTGVFTLIGGAEPREVRGASVTDGLFDMLGMHTILGRAFRPEEHQPGNGSVAVLDHDFWQREMGGDRSVLGKSETIGGRPYTIIGVLAPDAKLPQNADMYTTVLYDSSFSAATAFSRRGEFLRVFARARPQLDVAALNADTRAIGTRLQTQFPGTNQRLTFSATSLQQLIIGDVRTPLLMLFGAVVFVLLVACANVANLLMARASARQDELAVRAALGAGRGRLLRQLLTESVVLALVGAAIGLLVAYWGTRALVASQPADIPRLDEIGVNATVMFFTLAVAIVTGLAFGVLPAVHATGTALMTALREGGRGAAGAGGHRVRSGLVIAEMALAVVLLTGSGLLIRSFIELTHVNPGFQPERAISFRVTMQGQRYENRDAILGQVYAVLDRVRALPGVSSVGAGTLLPLSGRGALVDFAIGNEPPPPGVNAEIGYASASPEYFRAVGTPLVRGRTFTEADDPQTPLVAVINQAGARQWFPGKDAVGQRVIAAGAEREIVGVVADVLQRDPGQAPLAQLYVPLKQRVSRSARIVVRTAGDPLTLVSSIRAEVRALDPNLPVAELNPMTELVSTSMARPRFYTSLLTLFAAVALALAAIGIFGVLSYTVAQRSREISIRMALGAPSAGVVRMIVGRAMLLAVAGLGVGLLCAVGLGRLLRSQLFGVSVVDPVTLVAVVGVLAASAVVASWLPARRAASVDPASALRES
jgi:predicted permease